MPNAIVVLLFIINKFAAKLTLYFKKTQHPSTRFLPRPINKSIFKLIKVNLQFYYSENSNFASVTKIKDSIINYLQK
jgi:hypothetical protein